MGTFVLCQTYLSGDLIVVFPDSEAVLRKFDGVRSPCCIEVKSSAVFRVSIEMLLCRLTGQRQVLVIIEYFSFRLKSSHLAHASYANFQPVFSLCLPTSFHLACGAFLFASSYSKLKTVKG